MYQQYLSSNIFKNVLNCSFSMYVCKMQTFMWKRLFWICSKVSILLGNIRSCQNSIIWQSQIAHVTGC